MFLLHFICLFVASAAHPSLDRRQESATNASSSSTISLNGTGFTLYINAQNVVIMTEKEDVPAITSTVTQFVTESSQKQSTRTIMETITSTVQTPQISSVSLITLEISGTTTTVTPTPTI